jgi:tripartite ATP-independent transporter DctP family solute receptor
LRRREVRMERKRSNGAYRFQGVLVSEREGKAMKKLAFYFILAVFLVGLVSTAFAGVTLKAGTTTGDKIYHGSVKVFADTTEKLTNGRVKMNVYPNNQLGSGPVQMENVQTGVQDIYIASIDWAARLVKDFNIPCAAFAFRDIPHFDKFMKSKVGMSMQERLIKNWNTRIIAFNWYRLPRVFLSRKKPIRTAEDLVGMKMRVPDIPIFNLNFKIWGSNPTRVAWTEYYLALAQGVVDGGESTAEKIYPMKFHEVAPYITMANWGLSSTTVFMTEKKFQSLSPQDQKALIDAGQKASLYYNGEMEKNFQENKKKMIEEKAVFIEPDEAARNTFQKKILENADKFDKLFETKGLYQMVQEIK